MPDWVDPNTRITDRWAAPNGLDDGPRLTWLREQIAILGDAPGAAADHSDGELIDQLRSVMGMG